MTDSANPNPTLPPQVLLGMLPICGEMLWVDLLSMLNTSFCCLSLLQSSVNIMLENLDEDNFLPLWLHLPLVHAYACACACAARVVDRYRYRCRYRDRYRSQVQVQVHLRQDTHQDTHQDTTARHRAAAPKGF